MTVYSRWNKRYRSWFYKKIINNSKDSLWIVLRCDGVEFVYNSESRNKRGSGNDLRDYEYYFFKDLIKGNI